MVDNINRIEQELKKPFPANEVHWRVQTCGISNGNAWAMVLAYIDARAVMDRLDDVVGFQNWKDNITSLDSGKTFCELSVRIGDEWITRTGVAGNTNVEAEKGSASDSLKRAGVKWGIGRYLYHLDENFADNVWTQKEINNSNHHDKYDDDINRAKTKNGQVIYWQTPKLPDWALPNNEKDRYLNKIRNFYKQNGDKVNQIIVDHLEMADVKTDNIANIKLLNESQLKNTLQEIRKAV